MPLMALEELSRITALPLEMLAGSAMVRLFRDIGAFWLTPAAVITALPLPRSAASA